MVGAGAHAEPVPPDAVAPLEARAAAAAAAADQAVATIGGGHVVLAATADEVRACYLQAARHARAQDALLELLTQPDLTERRLAWEMLGKLGVDTRRDSGGGGAPTQILIQNHLPIPAKPLPIPPAGA